MLFLSHTIGPVKQKKERKMAIIFLSISLNMCFGCSRESSHPDNSFECPQHMFGLRIKKNNFQLCTLTSEPGIPSNIKFQKFSCIYQKYLKQLKTPITQLKLDNSIFGVITQSCNCNHRLSFVMH